VDSARGFRQFVEGGQRLAESLPKPSEKDMIWGKLKRYSEEYDLPLDEVIEDFNNLSCDIKDLEQFLKTKDITLLWTNQEDNDLLDNNSTALRYLIKIKGPIRVNKRRDFLGSVDRQDVASGTF